MRKAAEIEALAKQTSDAIAKKIQEYNEKYTRKGDNVFEKFISLFHSPDRRRPRKPVKIQMKELNEMNQQIDSLIAAVRAREGEDDYNQAQLDALVAIKEKSLVLLGTLREKAMQARTEIVRAAGQDLRLNFEREMQTDEKAIEWKDRRPYQEIRGALENAIDNPLLSGGREKYDIFHDTGDFGISLPKGRQSRELFYAIMAAETNEFQNEFVLGADFQEDHDANRRRYPYLYHLWLKHEGVNQEAIKLAQNRVDEQERILAGTPTLAQIIQANLDAGLDMGDIPAKKPPEVEYWEKMSSAITGMIMKLREANHDPATKGINRDVAKSQLQEHLKYAKLQYEKFDLLHDEEGATTEFTRSNLNDEEHKQILVEFAMMKYRKAMEIVDMPHGQAHREGLYHPAVRQLLIASIYDEGVAEYRVGKGGQLEYEENIAENYRWMLTQLSQSPYFNQTEVGDYMDKKHRSILLVAQVANQVVNTLADYDERKSFVDRLVELKEQDPQPSTEQLLAHFKDVHPALVKEYIGLTLDDLQAVQDNLPKDRDKMQAFLKKAKAAIQDPYGKKAVELVQQIKDGNEDLTLEASYMDAQGNRQKITLISAAELERYQKRMHKIELNYNTMERREKSRMQLLDRIGIRIEALYQLYLIQIAEDSSLQVDNWDNMLMGSREEFNQLQGLLEVILADSDAKGKENFLAVFSTLHGHVKSPDSPDMKEDHAIALTIYGMIKQEITDRAEVAAYSNRAIDEIKHRSQTTVVDRVSEFARGVWDMVAGPGQDITTRAIGAGLIFAGYKMLRKAIKGDGKLGKIMQIGGLALMAEVASSKIYGKSLIRGFMGLDTMAEAMQGTYEGGLLYHGREYMESLEGEEITEEEHAAALYELNEVPFHQVMEWYEKSGAGGEQLEGMPDYFDDLGINVGRISKGQKWNKVNKRKRAQFVLKHTVHHFFDYVAEKDDRYHVPGQDPGKDMLKERYIKMVEDPNHEPRYTELSFHGMLNRYRGRQDELTWRTVVAAEMDLEDVRAAQGTDVMSRAQEYIQSYSNYLSEWTRQHILGKSTSAYKYLQEKFGDAAEGVGEFLADMGEAGARKLYFTKEAISFWWEGNKYTIRRVAESHWELLKEGVTLPFEVLYAADQFAIPWTLTKLRQLKEIALADQFSTIDGDLEQENIVSNPENISLREKHLNPEYTYFGVYQKAFVRAFDNPERFYVTPPQDEQDAAREAARQRREAGEDVQEIEVDSFPSSGIGYYISETTLEDAGINMNDPTFRDHPNNRYNKMQEVAYKQAEDFYLSKGVPLSAIRKFMYPIHYKIQTQPEEKMHFFWRMPMPESAEYHLKSMGKWPDYMNPNGHKDRPPFMIDPEKTAWENLTEAFALHSGPTRTFVSTTSKYAIQVVRAMMASIEFSGDIFQGIAALFNREAEWAERLTTRDPSTKQMMDEAFASASDDKLAISEFYRDPDNANTYELMLNYAQSRKQKLYLGIFEDEPGYEGDAYLEKPRDFKYANVLDYYRKVWLSEKAPIPGVEARLEGLAAEEVAE